MALAKYYEPRANEPRLQNFWQEASIYHFSPDGEEPVFSIDTPPPTVSGYLHLGHMYSYTQTDLIARYRRMRGYNVFYPMGYDDNGLPTERLVEDQIGASAQEIGRQNFVEKCREITKEYERTYESVWKRMGLSIDWRYTYRTIDERSQRISQLSFIDLYRKGLVYRQRAPSIWCPECRTAIAQADLDAMERESEFVTVDFRVEDRETLPIATTRPELLPACVAVFVHPGDERYQGLVGRNAEVPLFGQLVPIMEDPAADPEIGSGAVMCCTFGNTTDKQWWYSHKLPLIEAIASDGTLTSEAGEFADLTTAEAGEQIRKALEEHGLVLERQFTVQSVRVHERCDTPVEYIMTQQWFIRVLEFKDELLKAGVEINWHPEHMKARYLSWVENLAWDWCISRQRYYGVPFPLWHCQLCGEIMLAEEGQLPVDPLSDQPTRPCQCGSTQFRPEEDVLDTWATSSMTPQIVGRWPAGQPAETGQLYDRVFPFSLRPQAHEIIRTWAFYTIAKSHFHFKQSPWRDVAVSGWGIAGEGMGKISKSRGGGPMPPLEAIERYSADAIRYWAASTSLGKDAVISQEKFKTGARLVTKLWNVARFSERFLENYQFPKPKEEGKCPISLDTLSPADRWILSRTQRLIRRATTLFDSYDYAAAKSEIEAFFWNELADNYLEMCKQRLYDEDNPTREGAQFSLYVTLKLIIQLFAPILPYVTEEIYQGLFAEKEGAMSIHVTRWPTSDRTLEDDLAELNGKIMVQIATAVRRHKSERNQPLNTNIEKLELKVGHPELKTLLRRARGDLMSITRANWVEMLESLDPGLKPVNLESGIQIAIGPFKETPK